jgi:hypothetical protein
MSLVQYITLIELFFTRSAPISFASRILDISIPMSFRDGFREPLPHRFRYQDLAVDDYSCGLNALDLRCPRLLQRQDLIDLTIKSIFK